MRIHKKQDLKYKILYGLMGRENVNPINLIVTLKRGGGTTGTEGRGPNII